MSSFTFILNRIFFLISLIIFCPFVFAHDGEMFGVIIGVLILVIYILFAVFVLALLCKKWNRTNKILEEISKKVTKDTK